MAKVETVHVWDIIPRTEFACKHCEDNDILVTGPHSHVCEYCDKRAIYGWYTTPRCEEHWVR